MAMKRSAFGESITESSVPWDDDEVAFGYNKNYLTPALEDEVEASDAPLLHIFLNAVVWWDVLDDKGNRLPVDKETLYTVPSRLIRRILDKIEEEQNPPE